MASVNTTINLAYSTLLYNGYNSKLQMKSKLLWKGVSTTPSVDMLQPGLPYKLLQDQLHAHVLPSWPESVRWKDFVHCIGNIVGSRYLL